MIKKKTFFVTAPARRLQGCRDEQISPAHAEGGNSDGKGADGNAKDANGDDVGPPKKHQGVTKMSGEKRRRQKWVTIRTRREILCLFTESAHWADSVIESRCPSVCVYVCPL